MKMQDNEFDNLFRSKLDDFETEPSSNIWQGIDAGLNADKRKKALLPLLSIAASIIVLATAGVLLFRQPVKVTHQHRNDIVKSAQPIKTQVTTPVNNRAATIAQAKVSTKISSVRQIKPLQIAKNHSIKTQSQTVSPVIPQQSVLKQPAQNIIADLPQKPAASQISQKLDSVVLVANNISVTDKPVQPVMPDKQTAKKVLTQPAKKHRIHSLGDMLNTVIAAVDKRRDKLIEFTDTDDDESVITAVNLGIVAVKKQN